MTTFYSFASLFHPPHRLQHLVQHRQALVQQGVAHVAVDVVEGAALLHDQGLGCHAGGGGIVTVADAVALQAVDVGRDELPALVAHLLHHLVQAALHVLRGLPGGDQQRSEKALLPGDAEDHVAVRVFHGPVGRAVGGGILRHLFFGHEGEALRHGEGQFFVQDGFFHGLFSLSAVLVHEHRRRLPLAKDDQKQNQQQDDGNGQERHDDHRLDQHAFSRHGDNTRLGLDTMAANQQAVRVDGVGCAGDQGTQVLPRNNAQIPRLLRQDDADLIHLVGQHLVQRPDDEGITLGQLVDIGEQTGRRQTTVSGQDTMGTRAADGQRRALDVADGDLQDAVIRAMINGQGAADLLYFNIPDDTASVNIQLFLVLGPLFLREIGPAATRLGDLLVVGVGALQQFFITVLVHVGHRFRVVDHDLGLPVTVPPVRDGRI